MGAVGRETARALLLARDAQADARRNRLRAARRMRRLERKRADRQERTLVRDGEESGDMRAESKEQRVESGEWCPPMADRVVSARSAESFGTQKFPAGIFVIVCPPTADEF